MQRDHSCIPCKTRKSSIICCVSNILFLPNCNKIFKNGTTYLKVLNKEQNLPCVISHFSKVYNGVSNLCIHRFFYWILVWNLRGVSTTWKVVRNRSLKFHGHGPRDVDNIVLIIFTAPSYPLFFHTITFLEIFSYRSLHNIWVPIYHIIRTQITLVIFSADLSNSG